MTHTYFTPNGGLPEQSERLYAPAVFTPAYAVIPASVMTDIVTSQLPGWTETRAWILARPLSGFAETFAQIIVEIGPKGGSQKPEPDISAEAVVFVVSGQVTLTLNGNHQILDEGGYAFIAPGAEWTIRNNTNTSATFHWIRKSYEPADGVSPPVSFVTKDADGTIAKMVNTDKWSTTRFVEPDDLRHDMHVNIVNFQPGGVIPFAETHVMEHGLYVLQGNARYLLNTDWVDVGPGDFMWLRAFCPQACEAIGDEPFRYLLYKDVNRHPNLRLGTRT